MTDSSNSPESSVDISTDSGTNSNDEGKHEISSKRERVRGRSPSRHRDKKRSRRSSSSSSSPRRNKKKKKSHSRRRHGEKKSNRTAKRSKKNNKHGADTDINTDTGAGTLYRSTPVGVIEGETCFTTSLSMNMYFCARK